MVFKLYSLCHKHPWFMGISNGISVLIWLLFTPLSSEALNSSGSLSPVVNPELQRKEWLQRIRDFSSLPSPPLSSRTSCWLMNDKLISRPNPGELPPTASLYIPQTDVFPSGNLPWNWGAGWGGIPYMTLQWLNVYNWPRLPCLEVTFPRFCYGESGWATMRPTELIYQPL